MCLGYKAEEPGKKNEDESFYRIVPNTQRITGGACTYRPRFEVDLRLLLLLLEVQLRSRTESHRRQRNFLDGSPSHRMNRVRRTAAAVQTLIRGDVRDAVLSEDYEEKSSSAGCTFFILTACTFFHFPIFCPSI